MVCVDCDVKMIERPFWDWICPICNISSLTDSHTKIPEVGTRFDGAYHHDTSEND